MTIDENIRNARLAKNLTQQDLASRCKTTKTAISRFELDRRTPSITLLQALAAELNVPIQDLIPNTPQNDDGKPNIIDDHAKAIGQVIRLHRKLKGITQDELAHITGVSLMTVRRYEAGSRLPSSTTLQRFAKSLDLPDTIFTEIKPADEDAGLPPNQKRQLNAIISAFENMNAAGRRALAHHAAELSQIPRYVEPQNEIKTQ